MLVSYETGRLLRSSHAAALNEYSRAAVLRHATRMIDQIFPFVLFGNLENDMLKCTRCIDARLPVIKKTSHAWQKTEIHDFISVSLFRMGLPNFLVISKSCHRNPNCIEKTESFLYSSFNSRESFSIKRQKRSQLPLFRGKSGFSAELAQDVPHGRMGVREVYSFSTQLKKRS